MDAVFWIGIAIGALISLIASVSANLAHSKIVSFLSNRKTTFHARRRSRAIKLNTLIEELHKGERDKNIYMLGIAIGMITSFGLAVTALTGASVVLALAPRETISFALVKIEKSPSFIVLLMLLFVTNFGLYLAFAAARRFRDIRNALENFETYEAEFRSKWQQDNERS